MRNPPLSRSLLRHLARWGVAIALIALCSAATAGAQGTGHIAGKVTARDGGAPLSGIRVSAYQYGPDSGGVRGWWVTESAITDSSGGYDIGGLAAGTYRVAFSGGNGYVSQAYDSRPGDDVYDRGYHEGDVGEIKDVVVGADQTVSGIDASMDTASHITGTVVARDDGAPLPGLEVRAYRYWCGAFGPDVEQVGAASVDSSGTYDIGGLTAGTYRVLFCGNSDYISERYDNVPEEGSIGDPACKEVVVGAGQTASGVDAALVAAGHITGTVTGRNGDPLSGLAVSVWRYGFSPDWPGPSWYGMHGPNHEGEAWTDSSGYYDIGGLPAAEYRVAFCSPPGYDPVVYPNVLTREPSDPACESILVGVGQTVSGIDEEMPTNLVAGFGSPADGTSALDVDYGDSATLVGMLSFDGHGLSKKTVVVQRYEAATKTWAKVGGASAGAVAGQYRYTVAPGYKTTYRMTVLKNSSFNTTLSSKSRTVLPRALVGRPRCANTTGRVLKRGKSYLFRGSLSPKHPKGTVVRIYRWRNGQRQTGYLKAKVGSAGTGYSISIRFAKAGRWKLRAVLAANALNSTSRSRRSTLTVYR